MVCLFPFLPLSTDTYYYSLLTRTADVYRVQNVHSYPLNVCPPATSQLVILRAVLSTTIPCLRTTAHTSLIASQKKREKVFLKQMKGLLKKGFYFSYTFDLTHALSKRTASSSAPLCFQADDRFYWNKYGQQCLLEKGVCSILSDEKNKLKNSM